MRWKALELAGCGGSRRARTLAARPERLRAVAAALARADDRGVIARGGGRSFGDAALNDRGRTILTTRLDRILSFDAEGGVVVAEPGVTFRDLLSVVLPRGWLPPVCPPAADATLGGALAADAHGMNHPGAGGFGDHVPWLELVTPVGALVHASPQDDADLYFATIGGLGLTGVVVTLCLRLARVPSNAVVVRFSRVADLDQVLAAFAGGDGEAEYAVGWLDVRAEGGRMGRGVLQTARRAEGAALPASRHAAALSGPQALRRVPSGGTERLVPYDAFLFPADAACRAADGRRGVHRLAVAVPGEGADIALRLLLGEAVRARGLSGPAALMRLGGPGLGFLSFPMPGYVLALDIPERPGAEAVLRRLVRVALDRGGRVCLSEDSCLPADAVPAMYPELAQFRAVLEAVDPQGRMQSDLARRLALHGGRA